MSEVTRILTAIEQGDPRAAEQFLPLVYEELRQLAAGDWPAKRPDKPCKPRPWFMKPICVSSAVSPTVLCVVE